MKRYKFKATIGSEVLHPKGCYYQGKNHIILVGCTITDHTIRRKERVEYVNLEITVE